MGGVRIKNKYIIDGDTVIIYIQNQDKETFECYIDLEDLPKVEKRSWHLFYSKTIKSYYAQATVYLGLANNKWGFKNTTCYMHRIIMNAPKELYVDHINHNTLDNRKSNLRILDNYGSTKNRKGANRNTTSGHRNVSLIRKTQQWVVQFQVDGKNVVFGRFPYDELDRAVALADIKRQELYGYVQSEVIEQLKKVE